MVDEFEGRINEEAYNDWKGRTQENLIKRDSPDRIINKNSYTFFKVMFVLLSLIILGSIIFYFYQVEKGSFKTSYTDNSSCINTCPNVNLSCPTMTCANISCPTPNININLTSIIVNGTI